MKYSGFEPIVSYSSGKIELEETIAYLANCLCPIIKEGESTLICFPRNHMSDFGAIAEQAVIRCGGLPVFWENDLRWNELLRLSFVSKASTIIAPPLVLLGLSKLAAYKGIPLYFYNAVLAGYPSLDWMLDGIERGLDCKIWGVLGPGMESVISGFSCQCGRGVHIRDDKFYFEIVDENGNELADGKVGRIKMSHVSLPENSFLTKAFGSIMSHRCPCGNPSPKLVDIEMGEYTAASILKIEEDLLYWNSILDCVIAKTEYGLEIEIVCFQGEKLPKLPCCAKLIVRNWNPETDIPLSLNAGWTQP